MGTWGPGNFEDDTALDWLHDVQRPLIETIETNLRDQDERNDHLIMAAVEVLAVICEQLNAVPPEPEQVVNWRDSYLKAWDGYIDNLSPKGDYKQERRAVIVKTFDRVLVVAKKWHAIPLRVECDEAIPPAERVRLEEQLHAALIVGDVGEITGGKTFEVPGENGELTIITGVVFSRDAARPVLRRSLQALNVRSATWICFGEPADEYDEVWVDLDKFG